MSAWWSWLSQRNRLYPYACACFALSGLTCLAAVAGLLINLVLVENAATVLLWQVSVFYFGMGILNFWTERSDRSQAKTIRPASELDRIWSLWVARLHDGALL